LSNEIVVKFLSKLGDVCVFVCVRVRVRVCVSSFSMVHYPVI